jgi:hypothetical protein
MGSHTKLIKNWNVFLLAFFVLLILYLIHKHIKHRLRTTRRLRFHAPPATKKRVLSERQEMSAGRLFKRFIKHPTVPKVFHITLVVVLLLTVAFEWYYLANWCAVSPSYYNRNVGIAYQVIDTCKQMNVQFWPDGATLLNVLRKENITWWDHDVDLSMLMPEHPKDIEELVHRLSKIPNVQVQYLPERGLIQITTIEGGGYGPHTDILLWKKTKDSNTGNEILVSDEYTLRVKQHQYSDVFPLVHGKWMGKDVMIPAKSQEMALAEFGEGYKEPVVYRLDCLENILHGRFLPV